MCSRKFTGVFWIAYNVDINVLYAYCLLVSILLASDVLVILEQDANTVLNRESLTRLSPFRSTT